MGTLTANRDAETYQGYTLTIVDGRCRVATSDGTPVLIDPSARDPFAARSRESARVFVMIREACLARGAHGNVHAPEGYCAACGQPLTVLAAPRVLSATTDPAGVALRPGTIVRSFCFDSHVTDPAIDRHVSYVDGVIAAIANDVMEGCPRYRIVDGVQTYNAGLCDGPPELTVRLVRGDRYPPVNGCARLFGGITASVYALSTAAAAAYRVTLADLRAREG